MRSILLTGGAGFIGSSLTRHLLASPGVERLVVLDRLTGAGDRNRLIGPDQDPRFVFVEGDITNKPLVTHLLDLHEVTGIFNLAAATPAHHAKEHTADFIRTNIVGTSTLLEVATHATVPLLQCSTDQVYGSIDAPEKFTEDSPLHPGSVYAASKASADLLCLAASRAHKQEIVITRSSKNYGSRQHGLDFVPTLVSQAIRDQALSFAGDGSRIRDWIHVDDHCRGMIMAFTSGPSGHIFNFGGNCERTNLGVARSILALFGKPESLISPETGHPGHPQRAALDSGKAARYFGWEPKCKFQAKFPSVVRELAANLTVDRVGPSVSRWEPPRAPQAPEDAIPE